jgi:hypothetical protein
MTTTQPKLVLLTWIDAHSPEATSAFSLDELDSIHRGLPMVTAGWLLRDDAYGVTIGGESCGGTVYRSITVVPRPMVVKLEDLQPARPRRQPRRSAAPRTDIPPLPSP